MMMFKLTQKQQQKQQSSSSSSSRFFVLAILFAFVCFWSIITLLKSTTQIIQIINNSNPTGSGGGSISDIDYHNTNSRRRNCDDNDPSSIQPLDTTTTHQSQQQNQQTQIQSSQIQQQQQPISMQTSQAQIQSPIQESGDDKVADSSSDDDDDKNDIWIQSYLISLRKSKVNEFFKRNSHCNLTSDNTIWFPAINGYDQSILDEYYNIFQTKHLNVSDFSKTYEDKFGYDNPHAVGCFMSHWHLIRMALMNWKNGGTNKKNNSSNNNNRPDALLILEDDASCAPTTLETIKDVVPKLPRDWDLLYIGGKPFSKYNNDDDIINPEELVVVDPNKKKKKSSTITLDDKNLFRTLLCDGKLGSSFTGPFSPNGTRSIDPTTQSYWKIKYITNTNSYIINPNRIESILEIIENHKYKQIIPIDIKYANSMMMDDSDGRLINAYMTPQKLCIQPHFQDPNPPQVLYDTKPFDGYYYHSQIKTLKEFTGKPFWMNMYIDNCSGY